MVLKELIRSNGSTVFQEFFKIKSPKFINTVYLNDDDPVDDIDFKKELVIVDHNYFNTNVSLVDDIDFKKELTVDINQSYFETRHSQVDDIDFKRELVVNVDRKYFKIHPPLFVNTLYIDSASPRLQYDALRIQRSAKEECRKVVKSRDEIYHRGYQVEKRKFVNVAYIDKVSGTHHLDVNKFATQKTRNVDKMVTKVVNQIHLNIKSSKFVNVLFYGMPSGRFYGMQPETTPSGRFYGMLLT